MPRPRRGDDALLDDRVKLCSGLRAFTTIHEADIDERLKPTIPNAELRKILVNESATLVLDHSTSYQLALQRLGCVVSQEEAAAAALFKQTVTEHRDRIQGYSRLVVLSEHRCEELAAEIELEEDEGFVLSSEVVGTHTLTDRPSRTLCAYCGTQHTELSQCECCACGALVACACNSHIRRAAQKIGHSCLEREAEAREVSIQLILSNSAFPFVELLDERNMVVGAISMLVAIQNVHSTGVLPLIKGASREMIVFIKNHTDLIHQTLLHGTNALRTTSKPFHENKPTSTSDGTSGRVKGRPLTGTTLTAFALSNRSIFERPNTRICPV